MGKMAYSHITLLINTHSNDYTTCVQIDLIYRDLCSLIEYIFQGFELVIFKQFESFKDFHIYVSIYRPI